MEADAHTRWMDIALEEARAAAAEGEVPIGAVVVFGDEIVGRGHNQRERNNDPTAHAELIALRQASAALGRWRLSGCRLYVTLEPCLMCMGAAILARLDEVVYGPPDPKGGAAGTLYDVSSDPRLNHRLVVTRGVRADEAASLLSGFFAELRQRRREAKKV